MRQAIIVIHGIGEQRPMSTLRRFVDAVIPDPEGKSRTKFYNKPDRMSETFELRKLQSKQTRSAPITDFYEYYWAYLMEGTRYAHVAAWLRELLWRSPRNVPRRLFLIWILSWALLVLFALTSIGMIVPAEHQPWLFYNNQRLFAWIVSALLLPALQIFVIGYVGDAARYLSPSPANIAVRQNIRANGIRLLRRLHTCGQYDRIIVVGHSLGSVIAFDVLHHYWQEVNTKVGQPLRPDQDALKKLEKLGRALPSRPSVENIKQFQQAQFELWRCQRKMGNPWLVTDLITLGSPMVHAEMLLANGKGELRERQMERELPSCPPQPDRGKYSYPVHYTVKGQPRCAYVLHHAAMFACTRWTNFYYPGDFVGGTLAPVFGSGIRDVRVSCGLLGHTPLSHTRYWSRTRRNESTVHALVEALALQSKVPLTKTKMQPPVAPRSSMAENTPADTIDPENRNNG